MPSSHFQFRFSPPTLSIAGRYWHGMAYPFLRQSLPAFLWRGYPLYCHLAQLFCMLVQSRPKSERISAKFVSSDVRLGGKVRGYDPRGVEWARMYVYQRSHGDP